MNTQKLRYGLFVCGASTAMLCFTLLLARHLLKIDVVPASAYYFLAVPPVWFYFRSEYNRKKERIYAPSRDATMVLLSGFLAFYLIPYLFQFLMFPRYSPGFAHYHHYALPALVAAVMLIRLHAHGGNRFCIFAGTFAGIVAFFFILTAIPVLSPVYYPLSTAVAALFLSVFLFTTAREDGLMKQALVRIGNIEDALWDSFRQSLLPILIGICLTVPTLTFLQPVNQTLTGTQLATLLAKEEVVSADAMLPQSTYFISIALIVLAVVAAFFYFEKNLEQKQYQRFTPLLWLSLVLLLVYSPCLSYVFYTIPGSLFRLNVQIIVWAMIAFIAGRFLNLGLLWLWSLFLLYSFVSLALSEHGQTFVVLHPLSLACLAIVSAVLSVVTDRVKILHEHSYPQPWAQNTFFKPAFLFSVASQIIVYLIFLQAALNTSYRHTWLTVAGMFLTAIPALIIAHSLWTSRHYLFFLPYTAACVGLMFALHENGWFIHLRTPHLVGCGLLAGLLTAAISSYILPCKETAYRAFKYIAAAGILLLILYAYFTTRDIDSISWQRFLTSGILTLGAAGYFRYLIIDERKSDCYIFFASGLTLSMLCFSIIAVKYIFGIALTPAVAFWIFSLPPLWFYIRSEQNRAAGRIYASGRDTSIMLLAYLLAFYIFPSLFRFLVFPTYSAGFFHYPQHALIALISALLLIRLHALGGGSFLVFTGVFVNIAALFFLAIRTPEVVFGKIEMQSAGKTFEFFSLIGISLAYFFLITTRDKGFMRKALVILGNIQEDLWQALRTSLFPVLLGLCHFLFFMTLMYPAGQQFIGIIFLLLAGLWIYTGYHFRNIFCYSFAYLEVIAAIFSCRFFDAYWPESWIIWLLLALFIALTPIYSLFFQQRYDHAAGSFYVWLIITAVLVIYEHITFYGLYSGLGIIPLFILWIAVFFIPTPLSSRENSLFTTFLGVLAYAPAIFFFLQQGPPSIEHLPRSLLAVVIISCMIVAYRIYEWQWFSGEDIQEFRIVHHLHWFLLQPHSLVSIFLLSTAAVLVIHFLSYSFGPELFARQFLSLVIVQGILVVYWFDMARKTRAWWWTVTAEGMISGIILTLRQSLPVVLNFQWSENWGLAVGVAAAMTITAVRPLLKQQDRAIRIPIRFTLFGLPIITVMYALNYHISFDTLSIVILIYSVLFTWQAYSEKDRFVLAYAFLGFNSFLILEFLYTQIQSLQAYLTPVCISMLILVEVFRDITSKTTANIVRGITLFILLGIAMFQAIAENYTSALPHLLLIGLSILVVIAAVFLRIRIFAASGLFCFIVDMIAIIYIVLSQQETEALKVILGAGLTVGGGLILSGYVLYRKNKAQVDRMLEKMKKTFYSWE